MYRVNLLWHEEASVDLHLLAEGHYLSIKLLSIVNSSKKGLGICLIGEDLRS